MGSLDNKSRIKDDLEALLLGACFTSAVTGRHAVI